MSAEVSTLSELLVAELALVGTNASVLPEVISQIARLIEWSLASRIITFEDQLVSIRTRVTNFYNFKPILRSIFESLSFTLIRLNYFTFDLFYILWMMAFVSFTFSIHSWSGWLWSDRWDNFRYLFSGSLVIWFLIRW